MEKKFKSEYEGLYLQEDKYVVLNEDDKDLTPIILTIPKAPHQHLIDGYGLHPLEQFFQRQDQVYFTEAERLKDLEVRAQDNVEREAYGSKSLRATPYKKQKEFWRLLEEGKDLYQKEILYIKRIHWYLWNGYWFFCKGKPTWITPWHFRYLNFMYIDVPENQYKPYYRDVDRRVYVAKHYAYNAKETFDPSYVDKDGHPIPDEDGKYRMISVNRRVYFGFGKSKRRREGQTAQSSSDLMWIAERHRGVKCVFGADTGENAEGLFKDHVVKAWNTLPLYLRPINNVTSIEPQEIVFVPPKGFILEQNYLDTKIVIAGSASEGVVDRLKTYGIVFDEAGKVKTADVYARHKTSKLTAAQGTNIHGWMAYPSTVEEMTDGGYEFQKLMSESDFYTRNINGQTQSGLLRIFTHGWDGSDDFIDPWGYSVIDTPTKEQLEHPLAKGLYKDYGIGAKKYWHKYFEYLLKKDDQIAYRQELRKNPLYYEDCWIGTSGDTGFNIIKIDRRISELTRKNETRRCDFRWKDKPYGDVVLEFNSDGKYYVSDWEFLNEICNRRYLGDDIWSESHQSMVKSYYPGNADKIVIGADQFDYKNRTEARSSEDKSRQSDGGIAVKWVYDPAHEKSEHRAEWDSDRFVVTYLNRPPSLKEFIEDVAKVCIYTGGLLNVESNKTDIIRTFIENGLGGYLWVGQDAYGKYNNKYGTWTGAGGAKSLYFTKTKDWVEYRVHKEKHIKYLEQVKSIKGLEDLTNKDLFTAGALCHIAETSYYAREIQKISDIDIDLSKSGLMGFL
jgi:hypothetical protein